LSRHEIGKSFQRIDLPRVATIPFTIAHGHRPLIQLTFQNGVGSMMTTAGALLVMLSVRLALQQSGVTRPPPEQQQATRDLVRKLSDVGADESIEVVVDTTRKVCAYVRVSTEEVLVEFALPQIRT